MDTLINSVANFCNSFPEHTNEQYLTFICHNLGPNMTLVYEAEGESLEDCNDFKYSFNSLMSYKSHSKSRKYSAANGKRLKRIHIQMKEGRKPFTEMEYQMNGAIILYPFTFLVSGYHITQSAPREEMLERHLHKYDIYPMYDGVVINLYIYENKMRISTSKGFDTTELLWCGLSYRQAVEEASGKSLDELMPGRYILNHKVFNPCQRDSPYLKQGLYYIDDIKPINPVDILPNYRHIHKNAKNNILLNLLKDRVAQKLNMGGPYLGYVFRLRRQFRKNTSVKFHDFMIYSPLYTNIKETFYFPAPRRNPRSLEIVYHNYFNGRIDNLLELAPEFRKLVHSFENAVINISAYFYNNKETALTPEEERVVNAINDAVKEPNNHTITEFLRNNRYLLNGCLA